MLNRYNSQSVWPLKDPALSKALKFEKKLGADGPQLSGGLVELSPYWPISHDWYPMRLSCCRKTEASTLAQKKWPKKITGLRLVANGQELQLKGWKGLGWVGLSAAK